MENFLYENTFRFYYYKTDGIEISNMMAMAICGGLIISLGLIVALYHYIMNGAVNFDHPSYFETVPLKTKIKRSIIYAAFIIGIIIVYILSVVRSVELTNKAGNEFAACHYYEYNESIVNIEKTKEKENTGNFKIEINKGDLQSFIYLHDVKVEKKENPEGYELVLESGKLKIVEK